MKKPIRILSLDMDILGEIDNYESMFFNRSWHGIGGIELRINRYKKYADTLLKNNLILIGNDLNKVFMIKHREIELDSEGKVTENWLIKGYALKSIVAQRITMPPAHTSHDNKSGNAETVMKHYINTNIVNPVDGRRKIPQLVIAPDLQRGAQINHASRFKNLAEEISTLSLTSGLGWDVTLDTVNKKWVFDIVEGKNLVASQSVNPPVIFSPQFDSLKSLHYTQSELNYKNVAIVAGQGEGVDRRVIEVGNYSAINRHEIFIDARDVAEMDDNEQPIPPQQIIQALTDRGQQQLNELIQEEYLEGQILMGVKTEKIPVKTVGTFDDVRLDEVDLYHNRNLAQGTLATNWVAWQSTSTEFTYPEFGVIRVNRKTDFPEGNLANMCARQNSPYNSSLKLQMGQRYILSFMARGSKDFAFNYTYIMGYPSQNQSVWSPDRKVLSEMEWTLIEIPFIRTVQTEGAHVMIGGTSFVNGTWFEIKDIKVELAPIGDATPWKPAPEDGLNWYEPSKIVNLEPINLTKFGRYQSSVFNCEIVTPEETSILVEYSFDNENWNTLTPGASLPFNEGDWLTDKTLYLRQLLYTDNQFNTPTISNFNYEIVGYTTKDIVTTETFTYESDYDLGDITTVQNLDWGVTMDARITDIKEIYETNGFAIEATFGNNRPTLIQKIKQELNQISGEIRK